MISAADHRDTLRADRCHRLFKSGNGARIRFRPTFRFQHSQAPGGEGGWRCLSGKIQARRTGIAAHALGDFNSVYLLTGGGPADLTHVLATLGIRYIRLDRVDLAMATIVTALPFVLPLVYIMMKRFSK